MKTDELQRKQNTLQNLHITHDKGRFWIMATCPERNGTVYVHFKIKQDEWVGAGGEDILRSELENAFNTLQHLADNPDIDEI